MKPALTIPNPEHEPAKLEAWAVAQLDSSRQQRGQAAIRLILMAADARQAAAHLRAMRAARLRLTYSQG